MRIEHKRIEVGSRIKLSKNIEMFDCTYTKGHEFNVVGVGLRGFDIEDDDGNKMSECLFIQESFILVK